jgi:hypothetical protein
VSGLLLFAILVLMPFIPTFVLLLPVFGVATWWILRVARRTGRVSFATTWPAIVASMAASALFLGLDFSSGPAAEYKFVTESNLVAGSYVRVAEADPFVYLRPCFGDPSVIAVPLRETELITLPSANRASEWLDAQYPSILQVVRDGAPLTIGMRYICPR